LALVITTGTAHGQPTPDQKKKSEAAMPTEPFVKPKQERKLLIYSRTLGFRHGSIPVGAAAITLLGKKTGAFTATHSEDPAMFDKDNLKQFDAVLFLNTTGDCLAPIKKDKGPLTEEERAAMKQRQQNLANFVKSGKGFAGIHSAADTLYSWTEYGDLLGAYFTNHPWYDIPVKVDDPKSPLTKMFDPKGFQMKDEIYQFGPSPGSRVDGKPYQPYSRAKLHLLLSIDASKFKGKGDRPDSDYGISWIHRFGKGRAFYCSLGHNEFIYWNPQVLQLYLGGLQYVLGDLEVDDTPTATNSESTKQR
jgi:type 1 glutamine amidotransferase